MCPKSLAAQDVRLYEKIFRSICLKTYYQLQLMALRPHQLQLTVAHIFDKLCYRSVLENQIKGLLSMKKSSRSFQQPQGNTSACKYFLMSQECPSGLPGEMLIQPSALTQLTIACKQALSCHLAPRWAHRLTPQPAMLA